MRLEPDAIAVDEADDRDRDIEQIRGRSLSTGTAVADTRMSRPSPSAGLTRCNMVRAPAGYRVKGPYVRGTSGTLGRDPGGDCSLVRNHEIIWRQVCEA